MRYRSGSNADWAYFYYDYNSRGDIVGLYDEDGSLECTYTYDAWGKLLSVISSAGIEMTSATYIGNLQSLKYRGYVYDRETGLYYLQSRYYDPVTHRFINADGLVSTGTGILGFNMFAYCNNNPIVFFDRTGKSVDYSYPTYSGITSTGYKFSHIPEHELGYLGQIKEYHRDGAIVFRSGNCPYNIHIYSIGSVPSNTVQNDRKNVIVYDNRNNTDNPSMRIYDSYRIGYSCYQLDILGKLLDYNSHYPSEPKQWNRTLCSMHVEWDVHDELYKLSLGTSERCKHVDLDNNDEGVSRDGFLLRAVISVLTDIYFD